MHTNTNMYWFKLLYIGLDQVVFICICVYWLKVAFCRIKSSLFLRHSFIMGSCLVSIHPWMIAGMLLTCSGSTFALTKAGSWNAHEP